mgnify:CR=1 FL=1
MNENQPEQDSNLITEHDLYLFHQGNLFQSYELMGSHLVEEDGKAGVRFTVWAPNASSISVLGDFNDWKSGVNQMERINDSGVWSVFIPGLEKGDISVGVALNHI